MSQKETLVKLFKDHHGVLTLGEILSSPIGYEWRARATELRRDGYKIELLNKNRAYPSQNTYWLREPVKFEETGQAIWA